MHADAEADGQPGRRELFQHLEVDLVRLIAAAELTVVGEAEQPRVGQQGEDLAGEAAYVLLFGGPGADLPLRDLSYEREQIAGLFGGQLTFHRLRGAVVHGGALLPHRARRRRVRCGTRRRVSVLSQPILPSRITEGPVQRLRRLEYARSGASRHR